MARRRFQRGSVFLRGKRERVWVARWREDVIGVDNVTRRVCRKEVLGTIRDFPTKKLALRELEIRLAPINSRSYRALRTATFAQFAPMWKKDILSQHKLSTQSAIRSTIKNHLIPFFGDLQMKDIDTRGVQMFIQGTKLAPRTIKNAISYLEMMWSTAKAWGYVNHDPFAGLVLPKPQRAGRFFFTAEEIRNILSGAIDPYRTFYWIAAETGIRAGELCGIRVSDVDLDNRMLVVRQSVWQGRIQSPKTQNAYRQFAVSPQLATHLRVFLGTWRPNELRLLFATPTGRPWCASEVMRSNLHPLLDSLGIRRCGLHAFRHANSSLMDRLNTPMKVRQERLGHAHGSDITMGIYTHAVSEDDRKVANQLGEMLCPATVN